MSTATKNKPARRSPRPPLYSVWVMIKQRCFNPRCKGYRLYGGRGITMCAEWADSYAAFIRDIGMPPFPGASIDRINNNLGYYPENCRWADSKTQARNVRGGPRRWVTAFGERKLACEWIEDGRCKTNFWSLLNRLRRGWKPEDAIAIPTGQARHG